LRGATSQQLGEAARQLDARIHRHQTALAGALVAEASQQRASRLAELDATAATLREASASLNLSASASR
jgi:hypothetical protein